MARPKKTESDELVAILDSFFTSEAAGNPAKLKCSLLEEYAARLGKQSLAMTKLLQLASEFPFSRMYLPLKYFLPTTL